MPLASHASHLKLDDHHNLDLLRYVYARQTCCSPGSSSTDRTMRQARAIAILRLYCGWRVWHTLVRIHR